jgi:hypothetical protein
MPPILHGDARDLLRLQVQLTGTVPAQIRIVRQDLGRNQGR